MKLDISNKIKARNLAVRQKFVWQGVEYVRLETLLEVRMGCISTFNLLKGRVDDVDGDELVEPRGDYQAREPERSTVSLERLGQGDPFQKGGNFYVMTDEKDGDERICVNLSTGSLGHFRHDGHVIPEPSLVIVRKDAVL